MGNVNVKSFLSINKVFIISINTYKHIIIFDLDIIKYKKNRLEIAFV